MHVYRRLFSYQRRDKSINKHTSGVIKQPLEKVSYETKQSRDDIYVVAVGRLLAEARLAGLKEQEPEVR
jgi:hypothetical protein